jgi:hypothetical protein
MKKTSLTKILILMLLFSTVSIAMPVQIVSGQFEGYPYKPPIITVLSPTPNGTCSQQNVPLNVTVQIRGFIFHNIETIRWLNYSLDGQTAIPMTLIVPSDLTPPYYVHGNDVLHDLFDEKHNLTIYVETAIGGLTGNFNETTSFEVDTSTTIVEPFPTTLVIASVITVAVVGVGLLIYFKKYKQ